MENTDATHLLVRLPQVCFKVNPADGIAVQDDVLEQNHAFCDDRASVNLRWRRRETGLSGVAAVYREDFASGVVNTGVNDARLCLQSTQDLLRRSGVVERKPGGTVRAAHFSGGSQVTRFRAKEGGP